MSQLAHDRRGSGEPLVLVHGLGSRRGAWQPVADLAAAEREVIAVDMPGFGESPPDGTVPSVAGIAERLIRFFDEIAVDRPHVAGNSLGGAVALELGRRGAARSVVAFSPIGFWSAVERGWSLRALTVGHALGKRRVQGLSDRTEAMLARPFSFVFSYGKPWSVPDSEVLEMSRGGTAAPNFRAAAEANRDYVFAEPEELRGLPLTIAWGRRDVLVPYWTCSRRARRMLPWARHVTLPSCGHVPFFDDPGLCARVLLEGSQG
ncbi:MAG: alpha/beta hydrolase [Actinomycetota bacterium]